MPDPELKVLEYKTNDVEPAAPEPIKVQLGDQFYVAHCPNDYDFVRLQSKLQNLVDDPYSLDVEDLLKAFFGKAEARRIDNAASGGPDATIHLVRDIQPCLEALIAHYQPFVEARGKELKKSLSGPKGR